MAQHDSTGQKAVDAAGNVGSGMAASVVAWLITNQGVPLSPALGKLLAGLGFVLGVAFAMVYRRYAVIITRRGSHERAAYDALRRSLVQGGLPARIYSERLGAILDAIDRFFGDAEMADRTLFPGAFGLRRAVPLWTTAAFDRCLLLALLYPIAIIFTGWTVSGHVGLAESALHLLPNIPLWKRASAFTAIVGGFSVGWYFIGPLYQSESVRQSEPVSPNLVWVASAIVLTSACALAGNGAFGGAFWGSRNAAVPGAAIIVFFCSVVGRLSLAGLPNLGTVFIMFLIFGGAGFIMSSEILGISSWIIYGGFVVIWLAAVISFDRLISLLERGMVNRWLGPFQAGLLLVEMCTVFAFSVVVAPTSNWYFAGPLMLFLGLLTLVNAPFDWASLGLTRALLRRGLELGGWWPYVLALADAMCAALVITVLTGVAVICVQFYDDLAARSAGEYVRVLPLGNLFDGIEAHPAAPEFWWIYAMLLSTMIPSLVNLAIGGASLVRGVPWVTRLLLWLMPERRPPATFNRPWIALFLTLQAFVGGAIGLVAQGLMAYFVIWWIVPLFGLDLLDLARAIAEADLPGQAIAVIVGPS